ncbi:putative membrane protein [Natranaerovirga hydrolytica]|uniref:Putative membrane protein n=1 Tax=Natranaerovirga hydrolytica TaxID=680378 RepID=A0A4R1MKZ3_9FIRM|nr:DUF368 domain-containing protein [Natranaerovirga hydrolytica]TCK93247.1 putative membrane protein [Natranaerovirga hydrolytica]
MSFIMNFLKGAIIGVANIVPGLSGGTMALIMGIYERLTESIGDFFINKEKRKEYFFFLVIILLGAIFGIIVFAEVFAWLLSSKIREQFTYFFIIGLILGSIPFILNIQEDMKPDVNRMAFMLLGLGLVVLTSLFSSNESVTYAPEIQHTVLGFVNITSIDIQYNLWLLFCGAVTALSMVLPGVSGSALLVSLGEYTNMLYVIDQRLIIQAGFFGVGVLVGIVLCAKVVNMLLKKYTAQTYYFIIGLMIASIYQIILTLKGNIDYSISSMVISVAFGMIGFFVAYKTSQI